MRVLHVIPSISISQGGPTKAIGLMECALTQCGIIVEVATTDDDGPGKRLNLNPCTYLATNVCPEFVESRWHIFPKRTEFYKISPKLAYWLFKNVVKYDVVHIHALFSFSSLISSWACMFHRVPYVIRPLGTLTHYGVIKRRKWFKKISMKLFENRIVAKAARVHFTSKIEQIEASSLGLSIKPTIIPLAVEQPKCVNIDALYERVPELVNKKYVLFLSRLDRKKNVEGLLRAWSLLRRFHSSYQLVIAGDGQLEYVRSLKKIATDLSIEDEVIWPGFVTGSYKDALLQHSYIFVLPSYSENFGIAAAEALVCGIPVILGKGVAIAGDVEKASAGKAISPTPDAIADSLNVFLSDDRIRKYMSNSAKTYAIEHYSLKVMGARLENMYNEVKQESSTK